MKIQTVFLLLLIILICVLELYDKNNTTVYAEKPSSETISASCHHDTYDIHIFPVIIEIPRDCTLGIRLFPILHNKNNDIESTDPIVKLNLASLCSHKELVNKIKTHCLQFGPIKIFFTKNIIEDHRSVIFTLKSKNNYTQKHKPTLCFGIHICDCGFSYDCLNEKWILDLGAKLSFGILS